MTGPGWFKAASEVLDAFSGLTGLLEERAALKRAEIPMREAEHAESVAFRKLLRDLEASRKIKRRLLPRLKRARKRAERYQVDLDALLRLYDVAQTDDIVKARDRQLKEAAADMFIDEAEILGEGVPDEVAEQVKKWRKRRAKTSQ